MAQQYVVDIGINDPLIDVVRKCNHNFRLMYASQRQQSKNEIRGLTDDVAESIAGLEGLIDDEAEIRQEADEELYELIQQGGTNDYNELINKPSIESVVLIGDKTFPDLGIFIDYDEEMSEYPASDMYAMTTQDINALWSM